MNRTLALIAAAGSFALLFSAFGFQYIGDMAPCKLCIWQRWPHGIAIFAGVMIYAFGQRVWGYLGAAAAFVSGAIGFYHSGVEQKWWEGPNSCTSSPVGALTPDELLNQIMTAPLVRCDEIPWDFLALSMATWNGIMSFTLFGIWVIALRRA
ncbi:disulfide bond formation protein B [Cochlodiniinecator piscidefendens]|uniref:disulfide bond formation protein B n=1 Tax=Cochlodiniinecator piscidefendens TaxID=2715756 RepID=UPI00140C2FC0|nr:disulfide bond formation protein B [Cochlodiniinecator piscidefendens]